MTTGNATPQTDQGRATNRRVPSPSQNAFSDGRWSGVSVVSDALLVESKAGAPDPAEFDPSTFGLNRINLFVWLNDRAILTRAIQRYDGTVFSAVQAPETTGNYLGQFIAQPISGPYVTNGMAALPAGITVTASQEPGQAAVATFTGATSSASVKGRALMLPLVFHDYFQAAATGSAAKFCNVLVDLLSESLLAGDEGARFLGFSDAGVYDPYAAPTRLRGQVIMKAADYLAGEYWRTDNVVTLDAFGTLSEAKIVGIYTLPDGRS